MKKIYSLFLLMLFAIVGAGQAWAEEYKSGDQVDVSNLKETDILFHGAILVDNNGFYDDMYYVHVYDSESDFSADAYAMDGTIEADEFPYVVGTNYDEDIFFIVKINDYDEPCLIAQGANNSQYEITFKLNEGTLFYTSFYASEKWVIPGDKLNPIRAYVISNINGNTLERTQLGQTGDIVQGKIAVLLESPMAGDYVIKKSNETPTVEYDEEENYLIGSDGEETFDDSRYTYYILSKSNGKAGFYWQPNSNEGSFVKNAPHKACLRVPVSAASNGFSIRFDDETLTAISDVNTMNDNTLYNLQGQRISGNAAKGLYIKNGNKQFVR